MHCIISISDLLGNILMNSSSTASVPYPSGGRVPGCLKGVIEFYQVQGSRNGLRV